jgi:hypothetical protein
MSLSNGLVQHFSRFAGVAQSVEQLIRNEKVGCSIHLSGTNESLCFARNRGFFM